jgi:SAM-dependent methyltransferase
MSSAPALPSSPVPGDTIAPWLHEVASTYAGDKHYEIYRGTPSGVGVTVPAPSPEELDAMYGAHYDYDAHTLIEAEKRWRSAKLIELVVARAPIESALDVGCMYGYLLDELGRRGCQRLQGIEISAGPAAATEARGIPVHRGGIEDYAVAHPEVAFDAIFAQHVLEHVRDPASFLRAAHRLLRPGGKLAVAVPHLGARTQRLFSTAWGWYQVPAHLFHFSSEALRALLGGAGFTIDREERRGGDSLFVLMTLSHLVRPPGPGARGPLSDAAKGVIRAASWLLRPYLYLGDEELVIVASKAA